MDSIEMMVINNVSLHVGSTRFNNKNSEFGIESI